MTVSPVTGRHRGGHTRSQQRAWASRFAAGLPCRARYAVSTLRAGIPLAFARVRSLRAPLANNEEEVPLPTKALPVVMSDCVTRAHDSNPAGPSLRYGLAQEALRRAEKVADREVRLHETTGGGVCRAADEDDHDLYRVVDKWLEIFPARRKAGIVRHVAGRSEDFGGRLALYWLLDPVAEVRLAAAGGVNGRVNTRRIGSPPFCSVPPSHARRVSRSASRRSSPPTRALPSPQHPLACAPRSASGSALACHRPTLAPHAVPRDVSLPTVDVQHCPRTSCSQPPHSRAPTVPLTRALRLTCASSPRPA